MYGCTDVRNVQDVYRGILWLHLVYSAKDASWTVLGGSSRNLSWGTPTSSDTDYICVRWEFPVVSSSLIFMRWECWPLSLEKFNDYILSIKVYMRQAKGSGSMNKSPMHPCTTAPPPKCTNAPMNYYRGLSVKYLR